MLRVNLSSYRPRESLVQHWRRKRILGADRVGELVLHWLVAGKDKTQMLEKYAPLAPIFRGCITCCRRAPNCQFNVVIC